MLFSFDRLVFYKLCFAFRFVYFIFNGSPVLYLVFLLCRLFGVYYQGLFCFSFFNWFVFFLIGSFVRFFSTLFCFGFFSFFTGSFYFYNCLICLGFVLFFVLFHIIFFFPLVLIICIPFLCMLCRLLFLNSFYTYIFIVYPFLVHQSI